MDKASPKPPRPSDENHHPQPPHAPLALQTAGLLYLLLRRGWTLHLRAPDSPARAFECVSLVKHGRFVEETVDAAVLHELAEWLLDLLRDRDAAKPAAPYVLLEQADLVPGENTSETLSEDHENL